MTALDGMQQGGDVMLNILFAGAWVTIASAVGLCIGVIVGVVLVKRWMR